MNRLTKLNRALAESSLKHASAMQAVFWAALTELESVLGCDVDGNIDLQDETVDSLQDRQKGTK